MLHGRKSTVAGERIEAMALELVETFPVGMLGCNCAIVADRASGEALVIDPGDEADRILEVLSRNGLKAVGLLHTHAHFDHVGASGLLARETGAPILLHEGDVPLYAALREQGRMFGIPVPEPSPVDRKIADGERVTCGSGSLEVMHTPGHSPGSVCFRLHGDRPLLFSGDTLFRRGIGRTDLFGGSYDSILESITSRLLPLPGDLAVLPGHGEETTIGQEARLNPFVGSRNARLT
jgi:glyoxylase-like metal-dependent hydrolase (beta-lactamase superfamily II)